MSLRVSGVRYRQSPQRPPVLLTTLEDQEVVVVVVHPAAAMAATTVFGLQFWDSPSFSTLCMPALRKPHLRLSALQLYYTDK